MNEVVIYEGRSKLPVVKGSIRSRSFLERLLLPTNVLDNVFIEHSGDGMFRVVLEVTKQTVFGEKSLVQYAQACFPGGDEYTWSGKTEDSAQKYAEYYVGKIGKEIFI